MPKGIIFEFFNVFSPCLCLVLLKFGHCFWENSSYLGEIWFDSSITYCTIHTLGFSLRFGRMDLCIFYDLVEVNERTTIWWGQKLIDLSPISFSFVSNMIKYFFHMRHCWALQLSFIIFIRIGHIPKNIHTYIHTIYMK